MDPLPQPVLVREAFTVPGLFEPGSHRFVDGGIEVFGRLQVDGVRIPIGIQAGHPDSSGGWPFSGESVSLCWWPLRSAAPLPSGAGGAVESLMRRLIPALPQNGWLEGTLSHRRLPSRTWAFELPGGTRTIEPDLLEAVHGGNHIDLYVQLHSNCVQDCVFCPTCSPDFTPDQQDADVDFIRDLAERVVIPAARFGVTSSFRFDADDVSAHRRLPALMKIVSESCGCPMHLVIPANRLSVPAVADAVCGLPGLMKLSTTLFGATPETHDRVAGRAGAFSETIRAIRNLSGRPLWVQGHFILSSAACAEIGAVADTLAHFGVDLMIQSLIADCDAHEVVLRPIMPDLAEVRRQFAASAPRILAASSIINVAITDFPACVVPVELGHLAQTDHRRETLYRYAIPPACQGCACIDQCIGVSPMYLELFGDAAFSPLTEDGCTRATRT